ncbi:uncharacterized protein LOC127080482 [Lathyrus oleraceus]|uniref:uncharacterized protein LOC127080482 n=1 Tax=Pisum sativum TaxID=3888 RepID=UPI0021CED928|nr:uncharacterized protein LOC127080482 [Pisum sativum]
MRILEIVERVNFQGIDLLLDCNTKYNEDLVKLFYTGVDGKFEGYKFACNIDYEFRSSLNSMLKKPFSTNVIESNLFPTNVTTIFVKKTLSLMGYTWDPTTRIYKTRKPVASSNIQHLEEDDDDDDDDEDEYGEDDEENNDDDSQPIEHDQQVTDHGG